ncbi:MAG: hypothetical protein IJY59_03610 [Bacteroidaceae bacterium]|nr:hypothetical protein [Bacteroidaceae bacterium]
MKYLYWIVWLIGLYLSSCTSSNCYYLDSITGDDANSGTSPAQAWKTLARLNKVTFKPGDKILFKSGTEYVGSFSPSGDGTNDSPIWIDKYGEGGDPLLNGDGKELYTILLNGNKYWRIANLEVMNKGREATPGRKGIWIQVTDSEHACHIELSKLTVHDVLGDTDGNIPGGGIHLSSIKDSLAIGMLDVTMDSCYIYRCRPWGVYLDAPENTVLLKDNFIR